jgi:hypothetical protein
MSTNDDWYAGWYEAERVEVERLSIAHARKLAEDGNDAFKAGFRAYVVHSSCTPGRR